MIHWKFLSISMIVLGLGSWLHQAQNSVFISQYLPYVSLALKTFSPITLGLAMAGAIGVGFGLLWNRWYSAIAFGSFFALVIFAIAFYT